MSSVGISVILTFFCLINLCSSEGGVSPGSLDDTLRPDILQKVEGRVQVFKKHTSDEWMHLTRVCLNGGDFCGYLRASGEFVIHNVPPGTYLVEVYSPNYVFDPVRVDISSKTGKIRAREVNLLKSNAVSHLPYPIKFRAYDQAIFFEKRESWSIISTLKNPMV